jgi:hypothetical protein
MVHSEIFVIGSMYQPKPMIGGPPEHEFQNKFVRAGVRYTVGFGMNPSWTNAEHELNL